MPGELHLPTCDLQLPKEALYTCPQPEQTNTSLHPHVSGGELRARVHLGLVQRNTQVHCLLAAPVYMKNVYLVKTDHMSPSCPTSYRLWAAQWPSPHFYWWLSLLPYPICAGSAPTVLAEICDAGTSHRKEPAGYAETGPSGPLWGPVRLTCATCFQVALS